MNDSTFHDMVIARAMLTVAACELLRAARHALEAGADSQAVDDRVAFAAAAMQRLLTSWWPPDDEG